MKKICILLIVCLLSFTACSEKTADLNQQSQSQNSEVDIDLSILSSTMIYAEICNINMKFDEYVGKSIKMKGTFSNVYDENTEANFYSVIVQDATACCAVGFEIEFSDKEPLTPDLYPEDGEEVIIIGDFETYDYYGVQCSILRNAYFVN